jgi:cathepsin L
MNSGIKVTSFNTLSGGDAALTTALGTIGPITAYIYASSNKFSLYTSGVYSDTSCTGKTVDHAIMLEGYGINTNGTQYYILRNSWGTNWGISFY